MGTRRRALVLGCSALAAILVVVAGLAVWLVLKRPLTLERWASTTALKKAGLVRTSVDTTHGALTVWIGGEGPTLALLHGAGDHAGAWAGIADDLVGSYRLLIPDMAGHGSSQPTTGPLPMGTIYGATVELLQAEAQGPTTVVGNSMGGWVALLLGAREPELVQRLVVVNGGATPGPVDPQVLLPSDRIEARKLFSILGAPGPIPNPVLDDIVRHVQDGPLSRFFAADDHLDHALIGRLGEVEVPVDLVWGQADKFFPVGYAEASGEALPAARLTLIPGCGHVPPRYCPDDFAASLQEVLERQPPVKTPELEEAVEEDAT